MNEPIQTGKILYTTKTGITLIITPPTLTARNAVMLEAVRLFPDPDPAQYARETGVQSLSGGTAKTDGRESEDYKHAITLVALQRREFVETAMIDCFVTTLDAPRQEVVENHLDELNAIRSYARSVPENDFEAVLKFFLVDQDEILVIRAGLNKQLPLSQEEVANGRKFFRLVLPGTEFRGTAGKQESSDSGAAKSRSQRKRHA